MATAIIVVALVTAGCGGGGNGDESDAGGATKAGRTAETRITEYAGGHFLARRDGEWAIAFHYAGYGDLVSDLRWAIDCSKTGSGKGVLRGRVNTVIDRRGRFGYDNAWDNPSGVPIIIYAGLPKADEYDSNAKVEGRFSAGRNGACGKQRFVATQQPPNGYEAQVDAALASIRGPTQPPRQAPPQTVEKPSGGETQQGKVVAVRTQSPLGGELRVVTISVRTSRGRVEADVPPGRNLDIRDLYPGLQVKIRRQGDKWVFVEVVGR